MLTDLVPLCLVLPNGLLLECFVDTMITCFQYKHHEDKGASLTLGQNEPVILKLTSGGQHRTLDEGAKLQKKPSVLHNDDDKIKSQ